MYTCINVYKDTEKCIDVYTRIIVYVRYDLNVYFNESANIIWSPDPLIDFVVLECFK